MLMPCSQYTSIQLFNLSHLLVRCACYEQNQTGTCPKKDSSTLFICEDHHMWWSSRQHLSSEKRKEHMAKKDKAPRYVRVANVMTMTLLRAGFKLVGPWMVFGNYPMYLLTVRGRKSGQPRTVPVAIIRRNGKRYVGSPYGIVDWVRNLRAAEEATLTRGRRSETVTAIELPKGEAAIVLREDVKDGNPFARSFGVSADSYLRSLSRLWLAIHCLSCSPLWFRGGRRLSRKSSGSPEHMFSNRKEDGHDTTVHTHSCSWRGDCGLALYPAPGR